MLFSSITFIYIFIPIVLICYFIVPKKAKNYVLLISSLFFYFFGEPVYTILLIISSVSDFLHSLYIEKHRGQKCAKRALISSIIINLGLLGFFKYTDFFISIINSIFGTSIHLLNIPLPIGISFFTFQTMSYTIDVYRGHFHAERNLATMATFVSLFPQLIAGPIVRYSDIGEELHQRSITIESTFIGIRRFVFGLAKKVFIANAMGQLCDIFRGVSDKTVLFYWMYAIAFTFQIYFDFSGYSDMAIGLGKIFGFTFPENFDYPYVSRSITEFWRRWHMTMGGWFRDYVYIPLGGNKCSKAKWLRNILIVWALTGLWHGAEWNFVVWGLMYGVILLLEKLFHTIEKFPRFAAHIYVMLITIIGFTIFNGAGLSGALADLKGMFGLANVPLSGPVTLYYLKSYAVVFILAVIGASPLPKKLTAHFEDAKIMTVIEPIVISSLLIIMTAYLVDGSFNPFLYFRF